METKRSLLGFYIVAVILLLLTAGLSFAWTPLRLRYWERKTRSAAADYERALKSGSSREVNAARGRVFPAATKLVALGSIARPAVEAAVEESPRAAEAIVMVLGETRPTWALPILVKMCQQEAYSSLCIVETAEKITNRNFSRTFRAGPATGLRPDRRLFLAWWEREGKAKYGGSGE